MPYGPIGPALSLNYSRSDLILIIPIFIYIYIWSFFIVTAEEIRRDNARRPPRYSRGTKITDVIFSYASIAIEVTNLDYLVRSLDFFGYSRVPLLRKPFTYDD